MSRYRIRRAPYSHRVLVITALLCLPSLQAQAESIGPLEHNAYRLIDTVPLASLAPGADTRWRLESAVGLGDRHQLRLTTNTYRLSAPADGTPTHLDSRATWRYTVLQRPSWAWRVGLTAPLGDQEPRPLTSLRSTRFGSYPLLHLAGEAKIAEGWQFGFDADGLMTQRGRAFELGLRVSYQLAPNFAVTGGYRLTEAGGDGEEAYGSGFTNRANVGVRLRF